MQLGKGEKRPLSDLGATSSLQVRVDFGRAGTDIAAFGLKAGRKIGDDRYVVLFSNPASPRGEIRLDAGSTSARFDIDAAALPEEIDRVVITATHDDVPVAQCGPIIVTAGSATFDAGAVLSAEKAAMLVELYRHNGAWRFGTIAQGFNGGLAELIGHFGGEVDAPAAPAPMPTQAPAPRPVAAPPPPPAPVQASAQPISLQKITLEKSKSISLAKKGASFGEIELNLNWNQGKRGFFGGGSVDLDLGCMFEFHDGFKGCIQALGRQFGNYDQEPFIQLSGDDRTGSVTGGETIRVNGRYFDKIKRLGVFALIYDGVPDWQKTDAVATLRLPDNPEVIVQMSEHGSRLPLCGLALIDNDNGQLKLTNWMRMYRDQKEYADDIGIFLRWAAGRK
jgi:tellurite resistance protein TerA